MLGCETKITNATNEEAWTYCDKSVGQACVAVELRQSPPGFVFLLEEGASVEVY